MIQINRMHRHCVHFQCPTCVEFNALRNINLLNKEFIQFLALIYASASIQWPEGGVHSQLAGYSLDASIAKNIYNELAIGIRLRTVLTVVITKW